MDHLGEWRALWAKAGEVAARCCPVDPTVGAPKFQTREQRETFEFLRTALVYHRNALDAFDPIRLHAKLRPVPQRLTTDNTLLQVNDPLFRTLSDADYKMTRGPFLASATVRVAVGVLAALKINGPVGSDFAKENLLKKNVAPGEIEWDRGELAKMFKHVPSLGCCANGDLHSKPKMLALASTIIAVHRDDFGHGEAAVGRGTFRKGREVALDQLHFCRVLEAQRVLIEWCLNEFR